MTLIEKGWYQNHPIKWVLLPLSLLFWLLSSLRRLAYQLNIVKQPFTPLPVVVVGNIGIGGNGKTPVVVFLVEQLKLEKRRFPDKANIAELLYSERFNQLQLALLNLLVSKEPSDYFCSVSETTNLRQFARQKLSDSLAELHKGVVKYETMDVEQFIEQRPTLHRSLLTGAWFGSLFEGEVRQQFRMPWLDIQQGLSELQTLWIIHQQLEKLEEQPIKIVKWQHSKVENLLNALTQSIEGALSMAAYWND